MNLSFTFEKSHSNWSVLNVFNQYFNWFKKEYNQFNCEHVDISKLDKSNPSGIYSPHLMTIRNLDNKKYIIVSYWDKAIELTWEGNGWDNQNCVDIITSSGVSKEMGFFTPFSYLTYSLDFENDSEKYRLPFYDKKNNNLFFRGFLYDMRYELFKISPEIVTNIKIPSYNYVKELNENRINLSLNGAGEICNRDIEILSVGSVLLRPKLNQLFHNPLIPEKHYVSFEINEDPVIQLKNIKNKFNEIKNETDFLEKIASNGLDWYKINGNVKSNVEILKKIINIEKLK